MLISLLENYRMAGLFMPGTLLLLLLLLILIWFMFALRTIH